MSKKTGYILAFLALALVVAFIVWKYTFKPSESTVESHKTDFTINAASLVREFEQNEDSANTKFLDKIIIVSGTIHSIAQDTAGYSVYLRDKDAVSGVMCSFDKSAFNPALLEEGFQVSIKGICTGYLMDVILNKCSVMGK